MPQGRPLGVHAIASQPMKAAEAKNSPTTAPGYTEAGPSVAHTPVARTNHAAAGIT